jgi:hydroxymethylbilane synthase
MRVTYATRRSALALAQCRALIARLQGAHPLLEAQELLVVTTGDRIQDRPLAEIGGKGLFVKEIEEALLDRRADFAVHSIKDVPASLPDGLVMGCIPVREDPRDALIAPRYGALAALPGGARVGTSSLRRMVSLKASRPDLTVVAMRGNVDTRLRKLDAGEYDAIVLARAGLVRLGLEGRATEVLPPDVSLPAVGQGALGIECRADDSTVLGLLASLHDSESATCVAAERGVLEAVGGDCKTPLAAYAERVMRSASGGASGGAPGGAPESDSMRLRAFVAQPDGTDRRFAERVLPWPGTEAEAHKVGIDLGRTLLLNSILNK